MAGVCAGLLLAVLLVYGRTVGYGFVNYDDNEYVSENPMVLRGLSAEGTVWAFTRVHSSNWHPLTWLSHQLDATLFGSRPWGPHLVNVLLHGANAVLVFLLLRGMTGALWRSAFVAAVFAVHPLRAESVAWVAERKDVLSAFFWFLTMGAYVAWTRRGGAGRYALTAVLLTLGLLAKPMLVTLPFALLLLDVWPLGRMRPWAKGEKAIGAGRAIAEKTPLFVLAGAVAVATFFVQRSAGAMTAQEVFPLSVRLGNAVVACVAYMGKLAWPRGLAVFYPHPGFALAGWKVAAAGVLLAGMTGGALAAVRRAPWVTVGWLWFLGTLMPVLGLVQVGGQAMADRYTYIPTLGLLAIVAWGLPDLLGARRRGRLAAAGAAAVVALAVAGWRQAGVWRDSITLFEHALAHTERNEVAHNNLGSALDESGRTAEAIEHYRQALALAPDYARAHFNYGNALRKTGRLDEAIGHYETAARLEPTEAVTAANLGAAYEARNQLDRAREALARGLAVSPDNPALLFNMGNVLRRQGDYAGAERCYLRLLDVDPKRWDGLVNLGAAYFAQGRLAEARDALARAVAMEPSESNRANLALIDRKMAEAAGRTNPQAGK